jgi:hypothetical protein
VGENEVPPGDVGFTVVPESPNISLIVKSAQAPGIVATSTRIRLFDPAGFVGGVLPAAR